MYKILPFSPKKVTKLQDFQVEQDRKNKPSSNEDYFSRKRDRAERPL